MNDKKIALIGFGEVGQILCQDFNAYGARPIAAWDTKFADLRSGPACAAKVEHLSVTRDALEAVEQANIVISAVTAGQTIEAARASSKGIAPGAYFLDLNSASPGTKIAASQIIIDAGGKYVEAAVMSPISPRRIKSPILLGGPFAVDFINLAQAIGLTGSTLFSKEFGAASAAKMCRSVIVKGIEALLSEALLTARQHNVDETVIDSLSDMFPGPDWRSLAPYMISRSLIHGVRRAEEMNEVAKTVEEAGLTPLMSRACAERQTRAAHFHEFSEHGELSNLLKAMLGGVNGERSL